MNINKLLIYLLLITEKWRLIVFSRIFLGVGNRRFVRPLPLEIILSAGSIEKVLNELKTQLNFD